MLEEISKMPVIDIHTHLNHRALKANDLSKIILYHYIATELTSSGMPSEILSIKDPVERVRRCLPFMKNIRNTSTFWALRNLLSRVFGFNGELDDESLPELLKKFEEVESKFDGIYFLRDRLRMEKAFLTLQFTDTDLGFDKSFFTGSLRLEKLSKDLSEESLERLEEVSGSEVRDHNDLMDSIAAVFERFKKLVNAIAISLNPSEIITEPADEQVDEAIEKLNAGRALSWENRIQLLSFVVNSFLTLIKDNGIVFQLMLGVERPVEGASPPDYAIVTNEPRQMISICPLFHKYRNVNFDVISASRMQTHELNVIAKNYRNVFVSGFWWYSYYPSIIGERIVERLQMLPMNKWCAFFSDAYVPEWCFGKLQLVRNQLAYSLGSLVEQGYLDMELALEAAGKLLYGNAISIYHLEK
ncbi:MAG: hypothetical protein ACUVQ0_05160 [Thermoproteota archaeon]